MGGSGEEKTEQIVGDWRKASCFSFGGQGLDSCVKNQNKELCMFHTERLRAPRGQGCLLDLLLYPQSLEQCLAHSRCSLNIY